MALDPQKYVDFGKRLVLREDPGWERELKKANHRKNGHPIKYPDSLFARMAIFKACTGAPYRALEGMCRESLGHGPDHSVIRDRILLLDMEHDSLAGSGTVKTRDGRVIRFVIDSSGMTPADRGECLRDKWGVRRDFYKLHVVSDADDGYILAAILTDSGEGSGDAAQLEGLVDMALENAGIRVSGEGAGAGAGKPDAAAAAAAGEAGAGAGKPDAAAAAAAGEAGAGAGKPDIPGPDKPDGAGNGPVVELYGDGAYGSRKNIAACAKRGIRPIIRVNITSNTGGKGHGDGWSDLIRDQLGTRSEDGKVYANSLAREERRANQKAWMKRTGYGRRWRVEGVFSSLKRIQGEAFWSRKWSCVLQEVRIRVAVHNMMVRMGVPA